ncbi:S8 family peptidase [Methylobacterium fujisawaense]|uniref:S8 family peptidase n=1 Tax=Methylobacterium fujisawaense TaxID=107400 RepID=UPI003CF6AAE7
MSDSSRPSNPLLHPVLVLRKEPISSEAPTGGKGEDDIVVERLQRQRQKLSDDLNNIIASGDQLNYFGSRILLNIEMYSDSFAVTKKPKDLLTIAGESLLTRPLETGYLAEVASSALKKIRHRVETGNSVPVRCDISRVKSIRPYGERDILRGRPVKKLWESAFDLDGGKAFYIWLAPFKENIARSALLEHFSKLETDGLIESLFTELSFARQLSDNPVIRIKNDRESSISKVKRNYRVEGRGRAVIQIRNLAAFKSILASGSPIRMEPVQGVGTTAPGIGAEPIPTLPPTIAIEPIVGIVDGGCNAQRYSGAEAWRERPYITDAEADRVHGNQVTSLIVHGHEWNNNLPLPELYCRFGVAQAVPKRNLAVPPDPTGLSSYIASVVSRHPETKVWNLSWNEGNAADPVYVSAIGHDLSSIARRFRVLFVISAGNVNSTNGDCIAPPADCEAALVVGSRQFDNQGRATDKCPSSLPGPGPDLRLVPHVCSYSPLRLLGGSASRGTSYSTSIVSALAAHSFDKLRDPTPDVVKALIIDQCDLSEFSSDLGWGTPSADYYPWNCPPGSVRLVFRRSLTAGLRYYWEEIPIPPSLRNGTKIRGRVSLTTIHQPLCVDEGGPSYISTRVAAAVQYVNNQGVYSRLCGAKEKEDTAELAARTHEFKWQPTQRVCRTFTQKGGILCGGNNFRLYARLFGRNMDQFGHLTNAEIPPVETVFVLTISDGRQDDSVYNSMVQALGNNVESAVIEQDLDIDL